MKVEIGQDPKAKRHYGYEMIRPLKAKRSLPYVATSGRGGLPGRVHIVRWVTVWPGHLGVRVWCGNQFHVGGRRWHPPKATFMTAEGADGLERIWCVGCSVRQASAS